MLQFTTNDEKKSYVLKIEKEKSLEVKLEQDIQFVSNEDNQEDRHFQEMKNKEVIEDLKNDPILPKINSSEEYTNNKPFNNLKIKKELEHEASIDCRTKASTKTASDPNFLEEFYNNSRLHLISTLGAEYKQLVNQLREKSNGKFPGLERLLPKG